VILSVEAVTVQSAWALVVSYIGGGEMEKVMHSFPQDMQSSFPALASVA
jgi:hypothetical protein